MKREMTFAGVFAICMVILTSAITGTAQTTAVKPKKKNHTAAASANDPAAATQTPSATTPVTPPAVAHDQSGATTGNTPQKTMVAPDKRTVPVPQS